MFYLQNQSTMSFEVHTANISLTQKATFWTNYISALKGYSSYIKLISFLASKGALVWESLS